MHLNLTLPTELLRAMNRCIRKGGSLPERLLFSACEKHSEKAAEESKNNSLVNAKVAQKLAASFLAVEDDFASLSEDAQVGLKAAMYYFALDEDDHPDFNSVHGFDDDVEIANACLSFAGREDLRIDTGQDLNSSA